MALTKYMVIGMILVVTALLVLQAFAWKSTNGIEEYAYDVIHRYDQFEIRQYEASNFSKVTMNSSSYKENSSAGFRVLAGYIFGKNDTGEKIAMTSPVTMTFGEESTMMFMIPSDHSMNDLPEPIDPRIEFVHQPKKTMAAITFSGWATDEKIENHIDELKKLLASHGIQHSEDFMYMGYNPPFEMINRRNEIVVEVHDVIGLN